MNTAVAVDAAPPANLDVDRLAGVVARIAPDLHPVGLATLTRYTCWSIALDDVLDDPATSVERLAEVGRAVTRITSDAPWSGDDVSYRGLADVLATLRQHDPDGVLVARFADALRDATSASVEHTGYSRAVYEGRAAPPTVEEYLAVAGRDVNYRSFGYALLIFVGEHPRGSALDLIERALRPAGHAVRLANDLRSTERDRRDRRLNVLTLQSADGEPIRRDEVRRRIDEAVYRHNRLLGAAARTAPASAAALVRSLRVAVAMYQVTDLR